MEYKKKKHCATAWCVEFCSIIIDEADQSAFDIPHFTVKTKAKKGWFSKVKLFGLLMHVASNRFYLYTLTD